MQIETGFLSLYLSMRLSYFCLVFFRKTVFVLWLFLRGISRHVSVIFSWNFPQNSTACNRGMVTCIWLKGGYYLGFVVFLDKGVGFESSEKLMKELSDPSPRLGLPRPKKQT